MQRLRQFVRTRSRGGFLAVYLAYALAIQAMMASVGLGMSAGVTPNLAGFVICSVVSHRTAPGPDDRQTPAPQCPFCFVAAQSAGHAATAGDAPAFPAYAGKLIATILYPPGDGTFVPHSRHRLGEARAPPTVSV